MIRLTLLAAALLAASPVAAQLPPPSRQAEVGLVEIATSAELAPMLSQLGEAFSRSHPATSVRITPVGSNVAMARLNMAQADIAIIGRPIAEQEAKGFEWIYLEPPKPVPLFRGSSQRAGHSPSLAVIVAANSPLQAITMAELARRLLPGGTGRVFMPDAESGTGRFLRQVVLGGAGQLDWPRITEFAERDPRRPGQVADQIARVVAHDPDAIGITDAAPRPGTRVIPVSDAGTRLERQVLAYAHPSRRKEATEFIAFLQSPAVRELIAAGPYRPLKD